MAESDGLSTLSPEAQKDEEQDWMQVHEVGNSGRRILAAITDFTLLVVLYVLLLHSIGDRVSRTRIVTHGAKHIRQHEIQTTLGYWQIGLYIAMCFSYFIVLEWLTGATLGKLVFSLRVVNMREERISFSQSLVRNLLRALDGLPYFIPYAVGFMAAVSTDLHQRFGDRIAKTLVIDSV